MTAPDGLILGGVSAISPTDAWMVGRTYTGPSQPAILHWDGSTWSRVASALPGGKYGGALNGVSAISATDVWAVGEYGGPHFVEGVDTNNTLLFAEHWDGTSWTKSALPAAGSASSIRTLLSVSAGSADNVWAVGLWWHLGPQGGVNKVVTRHWDGASWSAFNPSPHDCMGAGTQSIVSSVAAVGPDSAAMVGDCDAGGAFVHPLAAQWDGSQWSQQSIADPVEGSLSGVFAASPTDVWAVGRANGKSVIEHSAGDEWSRVTGYLPSKGQLRAVDAESPTDVWAVGSSKRPGHGDYALIEHWDGSTWTRSPAA